MKAQIGRTGSLRSERACGLRKACLAERKGGHFEKEDGKKGQTALFAAADPGTADGSKDCGLCSGRVYDHLYSVRVDAGFMEGTGKGICG